MNNILTSKRIFLLVLGIAIIFSVGCESIGLNPALKINVKAGSEVCGENILLQSPDLGEMYGAKWFKGSMESLSGQFRYEYDVVDAPSGLVYRFKPYFKQTRVDRGYIIETEYEAAYDYCLAAAPDVEPGEYDIIVEVNFFDSLNEELISILQIPYQLNVESADS